MSFTYDPASPANGDRVRLLIHDTDVTTAFFSDEELALFLSIESDNFLRASAMALETMASNEAFVQKRIRLLDLSTDGPATAKSLMDRAKLLRTQADELEAREDAGAFDIASFVYPTNVAQHMENKWQQTS